jgi:hypothetical protein
MNKTGRIVTETNVHFLTDAELQEWNDAVDEYHQKVVLSDQRKQTLLSILAFFTLSRFQIDERLADVPVPLLRLERNRFIRRRRGEYEKQEHDDCASRDSHLRLGCGEADRRRTGRRRTCLGCTQISPQASDFSRERSAQIMAKSIFCFCLLHTSMRVVKKKYLHCVTSFLQFADDLVTWVDAPVHILPTLRIENPCFASTV